jgi:uncharacterized protein YndB with AHSA1/START domain
MSNTTKSTITGTVQEVDGRGAVRMEDRYATGASDLWSALTDPERLARWVATVEGELSLGGTVQAHFTSGWEGSGRIEICAPPTRLLVRWNPGTSEETVLEATLVPEAGATRLVIEERGLPLAEAPAHGAGWQAHVEDLRAYLEGRPTADWHTRWTELIAAYRPES